MKDTGTQDIHTRLMQRYKPVPQLWFWMLLIGSLVISIVSAELYKDQLQLPWSGVLLGFAIATIFALPFGVVFTFLYLHDVKGLALDDTARNFFDAASGEFLALIIFYVIIVRHLFSDIFMQSIVS